MAIYELTFTEEQTGQAMRVWSSSRKQAVQRKKEWEALGDPGDYTGFAIYRWVTPSGKEGFIDFLNNHCGTE